MSPLQPLQHQKQREEVRENREKVRNEERDREDGEGGANVGDLIDFKWGNRKGTSMKNKDTQFYESFVYEGVEYFLYDCVYFYHNDHVETSIGKLVKIYEKANHAKIVKVVWFFRPSDIRNFLGDYQPCWNELFLASGVGKGVSNFNKLESIIGKCSVVCTSKDKRNPEPSETELNMADFFFSHTFDVGRLAIVDKFADEIDGFKVEQFFNRKGDKKTSNPLHVGTNTRPKIVIKTRTDHSHLLHCQVEDKAEVRSSGNVLPKSSPPKVEVRSSENVLPKSSPPKVEVRSSENVLPKSPSHSFPHRKRHIIEEKTAINQSSKSPKEEEFHENGAKLRPDKRVKTCGEVIEVTERPDGEKRKWFRKMPWEERLQRAQEFDTLVLLNNLDPSYTSVEVEDLVWHALKEKVEARMIEWSPTSNTYYGRALVIFKSKDAAESAISELNKRCLVLGEGRVVCAQRGTLTEPIKQSKFNGHLVLDRSMLQKQCREMRNAVSTSHCAQQNTIEYTLAVEWLQQYKKSDAFRNALCQEQMKEIQAAKSKLKMDRIFNEVS